MSTCARTTALGLTLARAPATIVGTADCLRAAVPTRPGGATMNVELVRVVTADGVRLEGTLRVPESPEAGRLPVDIVIFHHGVGGNFYNPSLDTQTYNAFLGAPRTWGVTLRVRY